MTILEKGSNSSDELVKFFAPDTSVTSLSLANGFDNTGNLQIWPGSEALTWAFRKRLLTIKGEYCLELGAGFLGLTSFTLAQMNPKVLFWVTDGNATSVKSLNITKDLNRDFSHNVTISHMLWGLDNLGLKFDTILAADCVFFEQFHQNFMECISNHLKSDGIVYISSPQRKGSLKKFVENVRKHWKKFEVKFHSDVNSLISEKYEPLLLSEKEIDKSLPVILSIRFAINNFCFSK